MDTKKKRQAQRKGRVRATVIGTMERPRLNVFRSNSHIYAQLIDDSAGKTLVAFSDFSLKDKKVKKIEMATLVGEGLAKKALTKKIEKVVFDRGGFRYHGRIKAVADGARKGGLSF
ncbi:MAG: 50S ribosomal protein L18 [Microgenomates group bacterium]